MPNWCLNTVKFEANEPVMKKLRILFIKMAEKEILTNKGQLPPFCHAETGYLFQIEWEEPHLSYLTKYGPNIMILAALAHQYEVNFLYNYEELNLQIYGLAIYQNGLVMDIRLTPEDFGLFDYDEKSKSYVFEGKNYQDGASILEILLHRKLMLLNNLNP